jgi:hypothetical protein
MPSTPE